MLVKIPDGHANAIPRPADPYYDRLLRRQIEEANKNGDVIINNGNGYFRPVPGDKIDEAELSHYLASEYQRAQNIHLKRKAMKDAWEKLCEAKFLIRAAE